MTRLIAVLSVMITIVMGVAVFQVTYQVQEMEEKLDQLNADILREHQNIHILNAEWSFLNDPVRLRDLAERHLGMAPLKGHQRTTFDELPAKGMGGSTLPNRAHDVARDGRPALEGDAPPVTFAAEGGR